MIGLIAFILAAAVTARGLVIVVAERRRAARLAPIGARVVRNQTQLRMVNDEFRQDEAQPAQRLDREYVLGWEYTLAGVTHQGERMSPAPITTKIPGDTIEVFYDRADPSVSRLAGETPESQALPWFIFAGVIAAVGFAITVISHGTS
ncbi:DUF3592 domain-containing protein [Roseomonas sp. AR75]|uniref:DUF3592 domain-containing protein n=1 Tax=Roseomonas sp. AR75 TaxID=2562311 RepID=UPI0010C0D57C|nr:DUF3592 domain-containing protein [Roseomonas sp. AR75]